MKISDLERSWFSGKMDSQTQHSQNNLMIMRRYIDNLKIDAIKKATDELVSIAIKNGIIFNRVRDMDIKQQNLACKKVVYQDYKQFIKAINGLPLVEREYFKLKLHDNLLVCKKKYYFYAMLLDFENMQKTKIIANSLQTAIKSLNDKNPTLDIVK